MSKEKITRRTFIQQSAAGLAALSAGACSKGGAPAKPGMPMRTLGKTGLEVSLLSFGGGSQFLKNEDGEWEPILERAVEGGINFFDTCSSYQWGAKINGEERFGEFLPRYRKRIVLCTKFESRDPSDARKEFDQSLKRLKTDWIDILMIHSIEPTEDLASFEKGIYRELVKLKEEGAVRFIGFSSMNSASRSKELMEMYDIDVALLAMSPTKYGKFAKNALPIAREKNVGVAAMKVLRDVVGQKASAKELLRYAWSQEGVATAMVGHYKMETLEENLRLAGEYASEEEVVMNSRERKSLEDRLAPLAGPHALAWARPGYLDGMPC